MSLELLFQGALLGFCIAMPIGPIGVLCIRRALNYGRWSGFLSGLGTSLADTAFSIIALFGITFAADFFRLHSFWLRLFCAIFLLCLGLKIVFSKPNIQSSKTSHKSLLCDFLSTFFLTLLSPTTIFPIMAIFAEFNILASSLSYINLVLLILGFLLGDCLWRLLVLNETVSFFRSKINQRVMVWINRIAGMIVFFFGIAILFI